MKKGQVTIFIVIGAIILIVSGIIFFYKFYWQKANFEQQQEALANIPSQFLPVETIVQSCFEDTAEQAVKHVALHGGYFNPKPAMTVIINDTAELSEFLEAPGEGEEHLFEVFDNRKISVGYWYFKGQGRIPPLRFIESQISFYVKEYLSLCLGDLVLTNTNFIYNYENINISAETRITNKDVVIKLHYPLGVSSKGFNYLVQDKKVNVPINFIGLYDSSKLIVNKIIEKPRMIPLTYLSTLNYNVSIYPNEDDIAYGVTDGETTLMFGNKIV